MSEADGYYWRAFHSHVVENDSREAVKLCRQALLLEPDHYKARMLLGMILGDSETETEQLEGCQHFMEAIRRAKSASLFCDPFPEEAAIYHVGICEMDVGNDVNACLLFLLHFLACGGKQILSSSESYRYLFELLNGPSPRFASDFKLILDRITDEYHFVRKDKDRSEG